MPNYELEAVGAARVTGFQRGFSAEDAVRRAADLLPEITVLIDAPDRRDGWQAVTIGGAPAGRVRRHQRMQFRRD